ncbi:MAG: hypothetical protein ACK5TO_08970 [Planctomycetaceae bacterium]
MAGRAGSSTVSAQGAVALAGTTVDNSASCFVISRPVA